MRLERIVPGRPPSADLRGAVLARDLRVGGARWTKGRRLDAADLDALAGAAPSEVGVDAVTVLVMDPGDLHEDEAALRLAEAVRGPGLEQRGPNESRVDLVAAHAGVLHVRSREVELLDRIDPLEVFTSLDGSVVSAGQLVASVKVAPHVVPAAIVDARGRDHQRRPAAARLGGAVRADARRGAGQGVAAGRGSGAVRAQRPRQGRVAGVDGDPVRLPARRGGGRRDRAGGDDAGCGFGRGRRRAHGRRPLDRPIGPVLRRARRRRRSPDPARRARAPGLDAVAGPGREGGGPRACRRVAPTRRRRPRISCSRASSPGSRRACGPSPAWATAAS